MTGVFPEITDPVLQGMGRRNPRAFSSSVNPTIKTAGSSSNFISVKLDSGVGFYKSKGLMITHTVLLYGL